MAETTLISPHAQRQLVSRLRKGDMDAFTEIYQAYTKKMIVWAVKALDDTEQAEDITHDILLRVWMNREALADDLALEPYLYTAVKNQVLQVIRNGKVKDRVFDQVEKRIWAEPTTENTVLQRDLQAKLQEAIADLPDRVQEVYRLSREQHLSYKEIADRLSISEKTVENQLGKALKRLRASMGDFLPLLLLFLGGK